MGTTRRGLVGAGLLLLLVGATAGCSNSSSGSSTSTTGPPSSASSSASSASSSSSSTSTAVSSGPATAQLSFVGDPSLQGAATFKTVSCGFPQADGSEFIFLLGHPAGTSTVAFNIDVYPTKINVTVASGSGSSYVSREFSGTGVTNFDASKGAQINTTLTEVSAAGAKRGTMGAVNSVTGTVSCGDQTAGTSTVVFSGSTAEGAVNGPVNPYRVECDSSAQGQTVFFAGALKIGSASALFETTLTPTGVTIFESTTGSNFHQYRVQGSGLTTLSGQGATVDANVVEQGTSGTPHTVHLHGSLTCGTVISS